MLKYQKKIKIAFAKWAEPEEPKPKTLHECWYEAGGFPFTARAIAGGAQDPVAWPIGTELQFVRCSPQHEDYYIDPVNLYIWERGFRGIHTRADFPRWQLLGHKT